MITTRRKVIVGAGGAAALGALCCLRRGPGDARSRPAGAPAVGAASTREVRDVVASQRSIDGAGVKLRRALGGRALPMLDPFLLLDEIRSDDPNDYVAGFPSHPHRGFETVTYMIDGAMEHKDSVGNHGHLGPGSAQWMTAGHGIVHSEMPKPELAAGAMWGFQLWVNLPRVSKMRHPRYQDIAPDRIADVALERGRARVIAGSAFGATGPVSGIDVEPTFVDLALENGARVELPLRAAHAAFAYVTDGAARLGERGREVRMGEVAVLGEGDRFVASCDATSARVLVFAGRPLGEPVARYGPFVMNTDDEIRRAYEDYRAGHLTDET